MISGASSRAISASYDTKGRRVMVVLMDFETSQEWDVTFPVSMVEELAAASPNDRTDIDVTASGDALYWPWLDRYLAVADLFCGRLMLRKGPEPDDAALAAGRKVRDRLLNEEHWLTDKQVAMRISNKEHSREDRPAAWPDAPALSNDAVVPPPADRLEGARQDRDDLLKDDRWYTAAEIPGPSRGSESDPSQDVNRLRLAMKLLAVRWQGEYLYPAFQFDQDGSALPSIPELLKILPTTDANWSAMFWIFQPTGRLGGLRPADVLAGNPDAVVAAAALDFLGDPGI